jgi:hypothetical protein
MEKEQDEMHDLSPNFERSEAIALLKRIAAIKVVADSGEATLAAQGQAMDGYTQLYNYNQIAADIVVFLEKMK